MLWTLAEVTPEPTPTMTVDPSLVTPGPAGFVAIALLAGAVVLLIWDMLRRTRRLRYRAEVSEALDAELAADQAEEAVAEPAVEQTEETDAADNSDR